jgi:F-type H+-transporting ATPase subunit delta
MAVAQRMYAGALYEAARDQDRVDVVHDQLAELAAAMETSPELEAFLANPQLDPGAKASVLEEVTSGADPIVRNFVRLVASKGRAGQLRAIAEEFEAIVDREQGRLNVELTTAYELDDEEEKAIVAKIEQASGRTVEATRSVDPDLIGGMILQAGSFRVDASVRGRLDRLRREPQGGGTHGSPTGPRLPRPA